MNFFFVETKNIHWYNSNKSKKGWLYLIVTLDSFNNGVIDYKYLMNKGNIIAISNIINTLKKNKNPHKLLFTSIAEENIHQICSMI